MGLFVLVADPPGASLGGRLIGLRGLRDRWSLLYVGSPGLLADQLGGIDQLDLLAGQSLDGRNDEVELGLVVRAHLVLVSHRTRGRFRRLPLPGLKCLLREPPEVFERPGGDARRVPDLLGALECADILAVEEALEQPRPLHERPGLLLLPRNRDAVFEGAGLPRIGL